MTIPGCDLSIWNTEVNYAAMKYAGIRFCIIKAGQGRCLEDPMRAKHVAGCDAVGVPWGYYWFSDYCDSGASNVSQFVAIAKGNFGKITPIDDLEFNDKFGPRPGGAAMLSYAVNFADTFKQSTGVDSALYTNRDILKQFGMAVPESMLRRELWIASDQYNPNPAPWAKWTLNQYDLDVTVPWCRGTIDDDEFGGDEDAFQEWIGAAPAPDSVPTPVLTVEQRLASVEAQIKAHWGTG